MINHFLEAQQQMIQARTARDTQDDRLQVKRAELRQVEARLADLERQGRAHPNDPIGVEVLQQRDAPAKRNSGTRTSFGAAQRSTRRVCPATSRN